jgi:EmrB/QacA subfamily drug resistance transporter
MSRPYRVLAICSAAIFLVSLDISVLNVAFGSIVTEFGTEQRTLLTWCFSGYNIAYAAALLTAGRIADRLGRKRIFIAGTLIFLLGSLFCALSISAPMLIGSRVLQALGGALLTPASLSLILPEFPVEKRSAAIGLTGAVGGFAAAAGPTIGGVIVDTLNWHWVFAVNIPIGLVAVVLSISYLRETPRIDSGRPDVGGALLSMGGVGLIVLAIVEGDRWGWTSAKTVGSAIFGVMLLGVFVLWCRRHPAPVLDLTLTKMRFFSAGNTASMVFSIAFFGMFFVNTQFLQTMWGYSAIRAGLAISPGPLMAAAFAFPSGTWSERFGHRGVVAVGCATFALGIAMNLLLLTTERNYLFAYFPAGIMTGIGVGLTISTLGSSSSAFLPPAKMAMGSATNATVRQIGAAVGIALASATLAAKATAGTMASYRRAWLIICLAALLAGVVMAVLYRRPTDAQRTAASGPART